MAQTHILPTCGSRAYSDEILICDFRGRHCSGACIQEQQNKISRSAQNWIGSHGALEVYGGDKLVRRFIHIDTVKNYAFFESPR